MNSENFEKLIDKKKYQVFILMSSAAFPFITFYHPWFIINKKGEIYRYDIRHHRNKKEKQLGYLHINYQPPFQGIPIIYSLNKLFQPVKLLKIIEGDENSLAKKMSDLIEESKYTYPYLNKYHFIGPNCATYTKWILNQFPEIEIKLPWNLIGKDFR